MGLERSKEIQEKSPQKQKIYVLPPYGERDFENMTLLVLTDGNNRAHGLNAGYDDGGKNVVAMAEHLAQRGDVNTLIACIMSSDNAEKRSEDFFWKMYQAVTALGLRIEIKKTLIKDGIALEYYGDLDGLKHKGEASKRFAEMVEAVCEKTSHIQDPKLKIILGINYDTDIALEQDADIIYRSGMETANTIRLSGIRTHGGMRDVGSSTLWPHVQKEEIDRVIDESKTKVVHAFHLGYKPEEIMAILELPLPKEIENAEITIPFSGPPRDMGKALARIALPALKTRRRKTLEKSEPTAWEVKIPHNNTYLITEGYFALTGKVRRDYDGLIAPGQDKKSFVLPHNPEANYATVHSCEKKPEAIVQAIRRAVIFTLQNAKLMGGERKISSDRIVASDPEIGSEKAYFTALKGMAAERKNESSDDIAGSISLKDTDDERYVKDHYTFTADVFTAKLLNWAEKTGAPQEKSTQFRALVNYIMMSFFIPYNTEDPSWEKKAAIIAKYMILIYTLDEGIFDKIIEGKETNEEKNAMTKEAKIFFQAVIRCAAGRAPTLSSPEVPRSRNGQTLTKLKAVWEDFIAELSRNAHPEALRSWFVSLHDFFGCSEKELKASETLGQMIDELQKTGSRKEMIKNLKGKYMYKAPLLIRRKLEKLLTAAENEECNEATVREIQLWMYLLDIHESIGAGLVYKTTALTMDKSDINASKMALLEEICILSNITNRIANDIAGYLSRDLSDKENKTDACTIMTGEQPEPDKIIENLSSLKRIQEEVEKEFSKKVEKITETWPEMGRIIIRATIGIEIYKQKHPRKVTLNEMHDYLKEFAHFGM